MSKKPVIRMLQNIASEADYLAELLEKEAKKPKDYCERILVCLIEAIEHDRIRLSYGPDLDALNDDDEVYRVECGNRYAKSSESYIDALDQLFSKKAEKLTTKVSKKKRKKK